MSKPNTTEEFIKKAILVHGDKYDYSKVEYVNCIQKVILICKEHGEFLQSPGKHLQGGCKLCGFSKQAKTKSKTKDKFIIEAIETHGDTYDYSKVEYKNNMCKVIIICKEHGEFLQVAGSHLQGHRCKKCSTIIKAKKQTGSTEDFISRAIEIHGDKYDYSKVEYINSNEKIIIICKEHGEFLQNAKGHIQKKSGCPKCGRIKLGNIRTLSMYEFIERATTKHGDKYDYSKVEYINYNENVIIICKKHGEFKQKPQQHLSGNGCSKCGKVYKRNTNEYIEHAKKIHGDTYDYSKTIFNRAKDKLIITCKKHGDFEQESYCHSIGVGCPVCKSEHVGNIRRLSIYEFMERAVTKHGDKFDYSKVEYINSNEKVIIICKIHGEFKQTPSLHFGGCGCPICVNKTEAKLYENILPIYPSLLTQFKQDWCKRTSYLPYDFCIPEYKIIIELDGRQHFQQVSNWTSPEEQFENDKYKEECANTNGYSVIRLLQEDVFYDTYDWVKQLCEAIEEIKTSNEITNIYLSKNYEYEKY
jgi:very-short-patch-repair endonuclease/uncharacterized C2H2 Zn-finger protein